MPVNIVNLPQYRVLRVEETDHDYHVTADPVDVTTTCPHCRCDRLTLWGTRQQAFNDSPMHGKRVGIYIDAMTFSQALPVLAENRMMTDRLVKWIGQQPLKRTLTSLADETGVVEGTIHFETPKWMGIDEIDLIKPRGVIASIHNNTIVELLPNHNKTPWCDSCTTWKANSASNTSQWICGRRTAMLFGRSFRTAISWWINCTLFAWRTMRWNGSERPCASCWPLKQRRGLMHDRFVLLERARP